MDLAFDIFFLKLRLTLFELVLLAFLFLEEITDNDNNHTMNDIVRQKDIAKEIDLT